MLKLRARTRALLIILLITSLSSTVFCLQSNLKTRKSTYSTIPFDTTVAKLPKYYLGHDIEKIYSIFFERNASTLTKDEFETSQQYQERLSVQSSKPIVGSLNINSVFAFKLDECLSKYDADLNFFALSFDYFLSENNVKIKHDIHDLGSYWGTNAFGASIKVDKSESIIHAIFIHNNVFVKRINEAPSPQSNFECTLSIGPEIAKLIKSSIQALIICKLVEPYISNEIVRSKPKFDYPYDSNFNNNYLHADVIGIIFYNYSSGEVLIWLK
jgi:hypothetical protein